MQPLILTPEFDVARALVFALRTGAPAEPALDLLVTRLEPGTSVIGLGAPLLQAVGGLVPGLRPFDAVPYPGGAFPSTQGALFVQLCGGDRGLLAERVDALRRTLGDGFVLQEDVETFRYRTDRDLTGYVDGTENPTGDDARAAAHDDHGGSFLLVQRWVHDLARFNARPLSERDDVVGRSQVTNEELEDAPVSAHVKRTAQEAFDPPAFMVRRSMPFLDGADRGLLFLAYGADLARFDRVLARMAGHDDGVVDALTTFTRATSGGYYYCPPVVDGRIAWRLSVGM